MKDDKTDNNERDEDETADTQTASWRERCRRRLWRWIRVHLQVTNHHMMHSSVKRGGGNAAAALRANECIVAPEVSQGVGESGGQIQKW
jgi:hypothetical protein